MFINDHHIFTSPYLHLHKVRVACCYNYHVVIFLIPDFHFLTQVSGCSKAVKVFEKLTEFTIIM